MTFITHTIRDHIVNKVNSALKSGNPDQWLLITLPAMPRDVLLGLADSLTSYCLRNEQISLTFKIAKVLVDEWADQLDITKINKEWIDERGNLTYYRNFPKIQGKVPLCVLCGVDRVMDFSSLEDFHTCNLETIWNYEMKKSFQVWMKDKLNQCGFSDNGVDGVKSLDRYLVPLLDSGRADLFQISSWLDQMDFSQAIGLTDVEKTILSKLNVFKLPSFIGFPVHQKAKNFASYLEKAGVFFNYTLFLEAKERDKAINTLDDVESEIRSGENIAIPLDEDHVRGPYSSGLALLSGLRAYIVSEDRVEREKLLLCDFVTIIDKLFKYKIKSDIEDPLERKIPLRKETGSPVEMVLGAVWQSLRDHFGNRAHALSAITKIEIKADRFKHDIESAADEFETTADSTALAREYLLRLVGGVDSIINEYLSLSITETEEIDITCSLFSPDIPCQHSKTAEPQLEFSVFIYEAGVDIQPHQSKFAWRLPQHHAYRLGNALIRRAKDALSSYESLWKLPVFHLPNYEELMRASSDEEIRRVMLHSIRDAHIDDLFTTNLLTSEWLEESVPDPLLPRLKLLSEKYTLFMQAAEEHGIMGVLFLPDDGVQAQKWIDLKRAYQECMDVAIKNPKNQRAGMLLRAFQVIKTRSAEKGVTWHAEPYEPSGIVTVLHPALLEMIEAQVVYLASCFNYAFKKEALRKEKTKCFASHVWQAYVDLAEIQSPLTGTLQDENQNLDAKLWGQGLFHRVGSAVDEDTVLSTRMLLRYGDGIDDEEEYADNEMFRESSESQLLLRLLLDYFNQHPHARDGISLAVFRNKDIQPVISAIHHYLRVLSEPPVGNNKKPKYYVLKPDRTKPYALSITFFTESSDDADVAQWISQWQERWEAAETEPKYLAYRMSRLTVSHRLVDLSGNNSFLKRIKDHFEVDITVLYDFIGAGKKANRFESGLPFDNTSFTLKFPILEKSFCTVGDVAQQYRRSRVISNRQFTVGAAHADLMYSLKNGSPKYGTLVIGTGDFTPWRDVASALHAKSEWVICIDPSIDDRLLRYKSENSETAREIIDFGSGVGTHGEDNYTISTEQFSLADVHNRLSASVQSLFSEVGWDETVSKDVARGALNSAKELSGLSLVRATGVDDNYIHDFLAYTLSRKMLRSREQVLCDSLISLDAYRHWFDTSENKRRPDLMWLCAKIDEHGHFDLQVRLIECKMGKESSTLLSEAKEQIKNGLDVLTPVLAPMGSGSANLIEDTRPDRRYWWMQLHRLISSKAEIHGGQQETVLNALEKLAEGQFSISWGAAVFAFWIDRDQGEIKQIGNWSHGSPLSTDCRIFSMGHPFMKQVALEENLKELDWDQLFGSVAKSDTNVCDVLEDIEPPLGVDEDAETGFWEDESDDETNENLGTEDALINIKQEQEEIIVSNENASVVILPEALPGENSIEKEEAKNETDPISFGQNGFENLSGLQRILLGNTINGQVPIFWEFDNSDLANRHMIIFGSSGTGKTYAIQCILCEMAKQRQNSLIIDYTNGFLPNHLEEQSREFLNPIQYVVRNTPLPINPFIPQSYDNGGIIINENANSIAKRITGIIGKVYNIGDQQYSVLHSAIMNGVERFNECMNFDKLMDILEEYIEDKKMKGNAQSIKSKIAPFILDKPFSFGKECLDWDGLFEDRNIFCNIFQLTGLDEFSSRMVTEFVLWDLFGHLQAKGKKTDPKVIVLDEVQNLDHQYGSPLSKYLTEGRKFGISLILATQTMSNLKKDEKDRMFNAGHKLLFKPADTELRSFAEIAALLTNMKKEDWIPRLASLKKGECYSIGPCLNEVTKKVMLQSHKIRISALNERGLYGEERN